MTCKVLAGRARSAGALPGLMQRAWTESRCCLWALGRTRHMRVGGRACARSHLRQCWACAPRLVVSSRSGHARLGLVRPPVWASAVSASQIFN